MTPPGWPPPPAPPTSLLMVELDRLEAQIPHLTPAQRRELFRDSEPLKEAA